MKSWYKGVLAASLLAACFFGGTASAHSGHFSEYGPGDYKAAMEEEARESRTVKIWVEEGVTVEVDGDVLTHPEQKKGYDVYTLPKTVLGRHHVKLSHPDAGEWQECVRITKTYPNPVNSNCDLSGNLHFGGAVEGEETYETLEKKVPPQIGYIRQEGVKMKEAPEEKAKTAKKMKPGMGLSVIGTYYDEVGNLWYHVELADRTQGWIPGEQVTMKRGFLAHSEIETIGLGCCHGRS